ncbi:MAG: sulfatase [bacterium]
MILILCDTVTARHLSCYGYPRCTSAFLDSLATEGIFFESCYSVASRTGPAVSSLFTSRYPSFHGAVNSIEAWDMKAVLREENLTLAEILQQHGYRTAALFSNVNASPGFGYGQGFDTTIFEDGENAGIIRSIMEQELATLVDSQPFFLYAHFIDPHVPYQPPERFNHFFGPEARATIKTSNHRNLDRVLRGDIELSDQMLQQLIDQYDAEILYFDEQLRRLFVTLARLDLLDSSLIIVTSDHGEEFLEHGKLMHGYTLYQEQLHVPLVLLWPESSPRRVTTAVSLLDIAPTVLSLLEIDPGTNLQGRDLTPLLLEEPVDRVEPVPFFGEASLKAVFTIQSKSVIDGRWKFIRDLRSGAEELYDLADDPGESVNLVDSQPDVRANMLRLLHDFQNARTDTLQPHFVPLDEETSRQLRSLGYLD